MAVWLGRLTNEFTNPDSVLRRALGGTSSGRRAVDADDAVALDVALQHGGGADERDGAGWSLLHHAVFRGASDLVVVRLLHEEALVNGAAAGARGAPPDDVRSWRGATPAHLVVAGGHARMLPLLAAAGANLDAQREGGYTPLMDAVERTCDLQLVTALLAAGARADAPPDGQPRTPLMIAANLGRADVVELLLRAGARCDVYSARGRTALHAAAAGGHAGICALLLRAGADPNALSADKRPALDYAVMAPTPSAATLALLRPCTAPVNVAHCLERALKRACDAPDDPAGGLEGAAVCLLLGAAAGSIVAGGGGAAASADGLLPAPLLAPLLAPVTEARTRLEGAIAAQERAVARIGSWDEKAAGVAAVAGIVLVGVAAAAIVSSASSASSSDGHGHGHRHRHRDHGCSSSSLGVVDAYAMSNSDSLRRSEAEGALRRLQQQHARVTRLHDTLQSAYAAALAAAPSAPPPSLTTCHV